MDQQYSDEPGSTAAEHLHDDGGASEDEATSGVAEVDAVLASLDALDGRPVAEHVEVFEKAHERLRRALDTPTD